MTPSTLPVANVGCAVSVLTAKQVMGAPCHFIFPADDSFIWQWDEKRFVEQKKHDMSGLSGYRIPNPNWNVSRSGNKLFPCNSEVTLLSDCDTIWRKYWCINRITMTIKSVHISGSFLLWIEWFFECERLIVLEYWDTFHIDPPPSTSPAKTTRPRGCQVNVLNEWEEEQVDYQPQQNPTDRRDHKFFLQLRRSRFLRMHPFLKGGEKTISMSSRVPEVATRELSSENATCVTVSVWPWNLE